MKENNHQSLITLLSRIMRRLHEEYETLLDRMADMTVGLIDDRKETAYK